MSIEKKPFGQMSDGTGVDLYILQNANGMTAEIMTYGCRVVRLLTLDKNGKLGDVALGHDTLQEYLNYSNYHGAVVGRYGNRIARGKMTIDGVAYQLTINEGVNQLHGGNGISQKVWNVTDQKDGENPSVTFTYVSADGEEGYPGKMTIAVTYTVTANNSLKIDYKAQSDKKTAINLTNHTFFNIAGFESGTVLDQVLMINGSHFTPTEVDLIPTGEIAPVAGTALDFTTAKPIGRDIKAESWLMKMIGGYDHNYVIDRKGDGMEKAAEVYDPKSGRVMEVFTDLPGVQLYTANSFPDGLKGKDGSVMVAHGALCLETQFFPDSPNQPNFPSCILEANKQFHHVTTYQFSVR